MMRAISEKEKLTWKVHVEWDKLCVDNERISETETTLNAC